LVRERALKFLFLKLKTEGKDLLNKEGEVHLFEEIKACTFEECSAEEFHLLMKMLGFTSIPKTATGQSMIVEMIAKMVDFEKAFNSEDEEAVDRTIQCFQTAAQYFSSTVKSTKFCEYLCLSVLPEWDAILSTDQAKMLKVLAETCSHTSNLQKPNEAAANVNTVLLEYLPEAPTSDRSSDEEAAAQFEFTKVECLLYAFHTVAQMSSFPEKNPDLFKELKPRLQHFALGIQGYMRKLREHLAGKTASQLREEETKLKAEALKSATNINSLIKDLLHTPPSFKTKIGLSWKPVAQKEAGVKRKSITFDEKSASKDDNHASLAKKKFAKTPIKASGGGGGSKGLYAPPQGKYSGGLQTFSGSSSGNGSGQKKRKFRNGRKKSF